MNDERAGGPAWPRGAGLDPHALFQRMLPHHLLSTLMHAATRNRFPPWKNWQIRWFIDRYHVDVDEAVLRSTHEFRHFNAFFTRKLVSGARPLDPVSGAISAPADGSLAAFGTIDGDTLVQAKGIGYSLTRLLGGDVERGDGFLGGRYLTVYLSPRDYHRVHMPVSGRLREMVHVPGRLFSVNPRTTRGVPGLLARNERVISLFDTRFGPMALVMVGAVFVGSIEHVWCGPVTPRGRSRRPTTWRYPETGDERALTLDRGVEMGRFNMGSTVVLLLGPGAPAWRSDLREGAPVLHGQTIAIAQPGWDGKAGNLRKSAEP